jgi:peptidoglycan/xylan/chitin deacetylase (PgdA/CDA1 family)
MKLPVITLMFDDGLASVYHEAFPLLESFGYKASIAWSSSKLGEKGYLTREQISELLMHGWALSDHSYSHVDMRKVDASYIRKDVSRNRADIKQNFGMQPIDFVFPASKYSPESLKVLQQLYPIVFTGTRKINGHLFPLKSQFLSRTEFSFYEMVTYAVTLRFYIKRLEKYLKGLAEKQEWLILFTHRITNSPGLFDINRYYFTWLIKTIHSTGVPVVSSTEVIKSMNTQKIAMVQQSRSN